MPGGKERTYQRLSEDSDLLQENEQEVLEGSSSSSDLLQDESLLESGQLTLSPLQTSCCSEKPQQNTSNITLRILKAEQSKELSVPRQATVSQLKSLVATAYDVPAAQQRLVCKGKPLKPDENSLATFNVVDGSVLHLFPLPGGNSSSNSSLNASNSLSMYNFSHSRHDHIAGIPAHLMRPIHFVPEVVQSIREVKMWCYILIITSSMDIFTNLSFLGSQGHPGRGLLDSILNILQTIFSLIGLYVGQLGLRCTTTAEADAIKQYVFSLASLAVVNIILKAVWVVDVILLAKKSLRDAKEEEDDDGAQDDGHNEPGKGGGQYTDDTSPDGQQEMSDSSFMIYFSIQAVIMAGIAISMWLACVNRARSFQRIVQSYEGINRA